MFRVYLTPMEFSFPFIHSPEPASIRPLCRTSPPRLGIDGFDGVGLSFAHVSTTKFCSVVAVWTVFAALFASVLS